MIAIVDDDKEWRQNALRVTKQYFKKKDIVVGTTSKKSDKYYLQFYKIYKDDFIATGSGKVKTK